MVRKSSYPRQILFHILFFPALFIWCELVLHAVDGGDPKYALIYILYGASAGFAAGSLPVLAEGRPGRLLADALAVLLPLVYSLESVAKAILQSYYPFSTLGTAADNRLFQFIGIIASKTVQSIPVILLFFLPVFLLFLFRANGGRLYKGLTGGRFKGLADHAVREEEGPARMLAAFLVLAAVLFHLLGLGSVYLLPWSGDVTPEELYESDTDFNYQVEELGLYNFLRLDVRHMLFPVRGDAADLASLGKDGEPPADEGIYEPAEERAPEDMSAEAEKEQSYAPNLMDVDLASLRGNTKNKDIQWLCDYFASLPPTYRNEYTGMFSGYNVVFITVEALSGYAVSEEYTPTLWRLRNEGFRFNNFYTALHYTSTSNGECQNLLGLYPKNGNPISMKRTGELADNMYFSLAQQLGRMGYKNWGYHNNWDLYGRAASHSNLGYYWQYSYRGLRGELRSDGELQWPQKDSVMAEESLEDYVNGEEAFNVYYLTVSGHVPFGWNWATAGYKEALAGAPYSEIAKGYIASVMECDRAVQRIIDALDESGRLDKTLFVIVPDHIPYANVEILEELTGEEFGSSEAARSINESALNFDLYKNLLCIWSSSMESPVEVDKVCCQVDILPTVSNLMGLEYDSRMLGGSDILSTAEGMVIFSSRCWKTDSGFYNRFRQSFTPAEGVEMTGEEQSDYVGRMRTLASCRLECTARIIESDFYDYAFGESAERISGGVAPRN